MRLWSFALQQAQFITSPKGNFHQEVIQQFPVKPPIICPPPKPNIHTNTLECSKHLHPCVLSPPSKALIKPLFRQTRHRLLAIENKDMLVFIRIPERINTINRQPRGLSIITSAIIGSNYIFVRYGDKTLSVYLNFKAPKRSFWTNVNQYKNEYTNKLI